MLSPEELPIGSLYVIYRTDTGAFLTNSGTWGHGIASAQQLRESAGLAMVECLASLLTVLGVPARLRLAAFIDHGHESLMWDLYETHSGGLRLLDRGERCPRVGDPAA